MALRQAARDRIGVPCGARGARSSSPEVTSTLSADERQRCRLLAARRALLEVFGLDVSAGAWEVLNTPDAWLGTGRSATRGSRSCPQAVSRQLVTSRAASAKSCRSSSAAGFRSGRQSRHPFSGGCAGSRNANRKQGVGGRHCEACGPRHPLKSCHLKRTARSDNSSGGNCQPPADFLCRSNEQLAAESLSQSCGPPTTSAPDILLPSGSCTDIGINEHGIPMHEGPPTVEELSSCCDEERMPAEQLSRVPGALDSSVCTDGDLSTLSRSHRAWQYPELARAAGNGHCSIMSPFGSARSSAVASTPASVRALSDSVLSARAPSSTAFRSLQYQMDFHNSSCENISDGFDGVGLSLTGKSHPSPPSSTLQDTHRSAPAADDQPSLADGIIAQDSSWVGASHADVASAGTGDDGSTGLGFPCDSFRLAAVDESVGAGAADSTGGSCTARDLRLMSLGGAWTAADEHGRRSATRHSHQAGAAQEPFKAPYVCDTSSPILSPCPPQGHEHERISCGAAHPRSPTKGDIENMPDSLSCSVDSNAISLAASCIRSLDSMGPNFSPCVRMLSPIEGGSELPSGKPADGHCFGEWLLDSAVPTDGKSPDSFTVVRRLPFDDAGVQFERCSPGDRRMTAMVGTVAEQSSLRRQDALDLVLRECKAARANDAVLGAIKKEDGQTQRDIARRCLQNAVRIRDTDVVTIPKHHDEESGDDDRRHAGAKQAARKQPQRRKRGPFAPDAGLACNLPVSEDIVMLARSAMASAGTDSSKAERHPRQCNVKDPSGTTWLDVGAADHTDKSNSSLLQVAIHVDNKHPKCEFFMMSPDGGQSSSQGISGLANMSVAHEVPEGRRSLEKSFDCSGNSTDASFILENHARNNSNGASVGSELRADDMKLTPCSAGSGKSGDSSNCAAILEKKTGVERPEKESRSGQTGRHIPIRSDFSDWAAKNNASRSEARCSHREARPGPTSRSTVSCDSFHLNAPPQTPQGVNTPTPQSTSCGLDNGRLHFGNLSDSEAHRSVGGRHGKEDQVQVDDSPCVKHRDILAEVGDSRTSLDSEGEKQWILEQLVEAGALQKLSTENCSQGGLSALSARRERHSVSSAGPLYATDDTGSAEIRSVPTRKSTLRDLSPCAEMGGPEEEDQKYIGSRQKTFFSTSSSPSHPSGHIHTEPGLRYAESTNVIASSADHLESCAPSDRRERSAEDQPATENSINEALQPVPVLPVPTRICSAFSTHRSGDLRDGRSSSPYVRASQKRSLPRQTHRKATGREPKHGSGSDGRRVGRAFGSDKGQPTQHDVRRPSRSPRNGSVGSGNSDMDASPRRNSKGSQSGASDGGSVVSQFLSSSDMPAGGGSPAHIAERTSLASDSSLADSLQNLREGSSAAENPQNVSEDPPGDLVTTPSSACSFRSPSERASRALRQSIEGASQRSHFAPSKQHVEMPVASTSAKLAGHLHRLSNQNKDAEDLQLGQARMHAQTADSALGSSCGLALEGTGTSPTLPHDRLSEAKPEERSCRPSMLIDIGKGCNVAASKGQITPPAKAGAFMLHPVTGVTPKIGQLSPQSPTTAAQAKSPNGNGDESNKSGSPSPSKAPPPKKGKGKGAAPPLKKGGPGGKGKAAMPIKPDVVPSVPLKKLYWNPIILADATVDAEQSKQSTVWDKIHQAGASFDEDELEALFAEAPPTVTKAAPQESQKPKGKRRRLFEEQRRRQIWFMLALLPERSLLPDAIMKMDDAVLEPERVELLLSNLPTPAEETMVRDAMRDVVLADGEVWDVPEEFTAMLIAIPEYALRVQAWGFLNAFQHTFLAMTTVLNDVQAACDVLQNSVCIEKLLALILYVGNYLNGGTSRGRADGFDIDTLTKLGKLKASQKEFEGTLVDFIIKQMEKENAGMLAEMFRPGGEFQIVHCARKHKLSDSMEELAGLIRQAEEYLQKVEKHAGPDEPLACRKEQLQEQSAKLCSLREEFDKLGKRYTELCAWFRMDTVRLKPADEFFGLWNTFLVDVKNGLEILEKRQRASRTPPRRPSGSWDGRPPVRRLSHSPAHSPKRSCSSMGTPRRFLSSFRQASPSPDPSNSAISSVAAPDSNASSRSNSANRVAGGGNTKCSDEISDISGT